MRFGRDAYGLLPCANPKSSPICWLGASPMATIDGYHPFCLLRAAVVSSRVDGRASVFFLNSVKYEMGMRSIGEEKRQRRVQRAWPAVDCILRLRNDIRLVGHLFARGFEDTLAHRTAVVRCCDGVAIRVGLWAERRPGQ